MHLYELTEEYRNLELTLLESDDQNNEAIKAQFESISEQLNVKAENIAKIILNYDGELEATTKELSRLQQRKKTLENKIEYLKKYVLEQMQIAKLEEISGEILNLTVCKSPKSIIITDKDKVPLEFRIEIPATFEIDKKSVLKHFENTGEILDGTKVITDNKYLKIK